MTMPPAAVCDRARQTRDARFDGLFYTAVRSTGIYCRPVCPAPTPKRTNIEYYPSASAAASAGYRPCLRCRPELAPDVKPDDVAVRRVLALIGDGWLDEGSVGTLAAEVGLSARHLRRLLQQHVGAGPLQVHQTRRLLLAKQLLSETTLTMTEVALAAGFASIRRFNSAFKDAYGRAPSELRRRPLTSASNVIVLRLGYRPPLDFARALARLRAHALDGIERVDDVAYERGIGEGSRPASVRITHDAHRHVLMLAVDGVDARAIQGIVRRTRRTFDLDADLAAAHRVLRRDAELATVLRRERGTRLPGAWDGFEAVVRLLLSSRIGPCAARDAMAALVDALGPTVVDAPIGLHRRFPSPACLAAADVEAIVGDSRVASRLRALASTVDDRVLDFDAGQPPDEFVARLVAASGMPSYEAAAAAMLALGNPDAQAIDASAADVHERVMRADAWRPWRAYGAMLLGWWDEETRSRASSMLHVDAASIAITKRR